jgi:putative tributyrin esterase
VSAALETLCVRSRSLDCTLPCTLLHSTANPPEAVLYLLHGGFSHHAEWAQKVDLQQMVSAWPMAVALPEGEFSLWMRGDDGRDFEGYAAFDVPEAVEAHLGLQLPGERRAVAGISMGGLGAFRLGLSYPARYRAVGSLSGAFGMGWWNLGRTEGSPFLRALGPWGSQSRAAVDPFATLERALALGADALPALWLATGEQDDTEVTEVHRRLHLALTAAHVAHSYMEAPGGHDWDFWTRQTPALLAAVAAALQL